MVSMFASRDFDRRREATCSALIDAAVAIISVRALMRARLYKSSSACVRRLKKRRRRRALA